MNFDFGEVLTKAWQIIWKHKVLWLFGILAGCGSNGGNVNYQMGQGDFSQSPDIPPQALRWFHTIQDHITAIIIVTLTLVCIIWVIVIFLHTVGRIGLIRGAAQADGGAEKLVLGELFSGSMPYFWRMFGLSLIIIIPSMIFFLGFMVLIGGILFSSFTENDGSLISFLAILPLFLGCLCLLAPVMFVVGMIFRQAENAIVLENQSVLPAISRGWDVFKSNLGPIIIMALILLVLGLVVGFIIAIPIFLVVFPASFAFLLTGGRFEALNVLMGLCMCLFVPIMVILRGIITSYSQSAWTLTYLRITQKLNSPIEPADSDKTLLAAGPNA
jgi:hypothetical protein